MSKHCQVFSTALKHKITDSFKGLQTKTVQDEDNKQQNQTANKAKHWENKTNLPVLGEKSPRPNFLLPRYHRQVCDLQLA